jgi:hypothetical protein
VSGDVALLQDDESGRTAKLVQVLGRLPVQPSWVLIGGLAVNVRLGRVHRVTNDIDTVTHDPPRFVELLVEGDAEKLSAAKLQLRDPEVEVDVMESTEGQALPPGDEDRAFALVRRWAMRSASEVEVGSVRRDGEVTARSRIQVASRAALIALKTVSIPRRSRGHYPQKVGSDIQDLYRLVASQGVDEILAPFRELDPGVRAWVANALVHTFSAGTADLRYSAARLRRYASNADTRRTPMPSRSARTTWPSWVCSAPRLEASCKERMWMRSTGAAAPVREDLGLLERERVALRPRAGAR